MRLTVHVTNRELDALEDVLTVWIMCPTHTRRSPTASERQRVLWQYGCRSCNRLRMKSVETSLELWSRLCAAYDRGDAGSPTRSSRSARSRPTMRSPAPAPAPKSARRQSGS
jgi:hypothetical protein